MGNVNTAILNQTENSYDATQRDPEVSPIPSTVTAEFKSATFFNPDQVNLLLMLKLKNDYKFKRPNSNKSKIWKSIADEFATKGYTVSGEQLEKLFEVLRKLYFKKKKEPLAALEWPYFRNMNKLCRDEIAVISTTHPTAQDDYDEPVPKRIKKATTKSEEVEHKDETTEDTEKTKVCHLRENYFKLKYKKMHWEKQKSASLNLMRLERAEAMAELSCAFQELADPFTNSIKNTSASRLQSDSPELPEVTSNASLAPEAILTTADAMTDLREALQQLSESQVYDAIQQESHDRNLTSLQIEQIMATEKSTEAFKGMSDPEIHIPTTDPLIDEIIYENYDPNQFLDETGVDKEEISLKPSLKQEKAEWKKRAKASHANLLKEKLAAMQELTSALRELNESRGPDALKKCAKKIYIFSSDGTHSSFQSYSVEE